MKVGCVALAHVICLQARSGNLKKQTTKVSAMSVKDMFAGADMSAVTKFAGGGSNEEDDDGKSDFLKEIERFVCAFTPHCRSNLI